MDVFEKAKNIGVSEMARDRAERWFKFSLDGYDLTDPEQKEMLVVALQNQFNSFALDVLIASSHVDRINEKIEVFSEGDKVIYIPENKVYDFGYKGSSGMAIIYKEGERNMQDSFAVNFSDIRKKV
jgi:hypothetical protein